MLNKSLFKRFFLSAFVVFFCFILAMPTPCFASIPQGSLNLNNSSRSNEEEEEDYDWLLEIFEKLDSKEKNNSEEEEEEEKKKEEENNEGNHHRDDDSDPSGGGNGDRDLNNYNSAGLGEAEATSLIPQNVCGGEEEYLPDAFEEEEEEEFFEDLDVSGIIEL